MPKFNSLKELETYVQKNVLQMISRSKTIERVLAEAVADHAWRYVYDAYDPVSYNRREDDGGLADTRNYAITDFGVRDGQVFLVFENLTQGSDSLNGTYLVDTIEEGIKSNWNNPDGDWSKARPFMQETINSLNANPSELINALKGALSSKGFTVR